MYEEDELLPLSALQHLLFCERQCALIHVERMWADNDLTVEGSYLHQRVDDTGPRSESRGALRISRGLALRSRRLGLVGRADVVEFHRIVEATLAQPSSSSSPVTGVVLPAVAGTWRPFPVEHKRGKPKSDLSDKVQLCAQALCLEEMLGVPVADGALFYGKRQRRLTVEFDAGLRRATEQAAGRLHELIAGRQTPPAVRAPKCRRCSLVELCLPDSMESGRSARGYLDRAIRHALSEE